MKVLGKKDILDADDKYVEPLEIPEWGGSVYIRRVSGRERDRFEEMVTDDKQKVTIKNFRAKFAVMVLCDEKGIPLFEYKDAPLLGSKFGGALDKVLEAGRRVNGISEQDVEKMVGNSDAGQSEDSGSD